MTDDNSITQADTPKRRARKAAEDAVRGRVGHFQLLEMLGDGGMGMVYSAYDLHLDRKVAIKILHEGSTDDEQLRNQRLLREAQAMAKLSHPNVVPIYEVGIDGHTVFLAMEYVAGQTLAQWLDTKPPLSAIIDVFRQAGRGLAVAHEAGIVHRDFKPANVLVDGHGHARVTDFGIARVISVNEPEEITTGRVVRVDVGVANGDITPPSLSTPLTERGAVIGTPAYMSPEQHRGATVDARSDQFSFCVTLYEALFGKRPFEGSGKELTNNVLDAPLELPDSSAPSWITTIVRRGLERDPDRRFSSMTELVAALGRAPVQRRRRIAAGALAAVAIASAAAVAGWGLRADGEAPCIGAEAHLAGVWDDGVRAAIERSFMASKVAYAGASAHGVTTVLDAYRGRWIAMHAEACRATRVTGAQSTRVLDLRMACLDDRLGELRALTSLLATAADAKTVETALEAASSLTPVDRCADTAAMQTNAEPATPVLQVQRAAFYERLDRLVALERVGHYKEALAPARALAAEMRTNVEPTALAIALRLQGALEVDVGDLKTAETTLANALRQARRTSDPDLFVTTAIELVEALSHAGIAKSREALGVVRVAQAMVDRTSDPAVPIRLLVVQANDLLMLAHPADALPLLDDARKRCHRTLGDDHILCLHVLSVRAIALKLAKNHVEARAAYEGVVAELTRVAGPLHPATLMARLDTCRAMTASGDHAHAPACYEAAFADADSVLGPGHRAVLMAREYEGQSLAAIVQLDRARQVLTAAFDHVSDDLWQEHWYVAADIARTLGEVELELGAPAAALEHCQLAESAIEAPYRGISGATCLGEAHLALGDPARALATLEPLHAQIDGADPSQVARWQFAYARALWTGRHQAAAARELATRARALVSAPHQVQIDAWLATVPR